MFEPIQKFFRERIEPVADVDEDACRMRIATSVLLLEAARADSDFSPTEREAIEAMLGERFDLDEAQTQELLAAAEESRDRTDDLYDFARLINESFSRPRKLAILELLWRVVYSDGVLEAHEDALMHKAGRLLGVRHEELMALKLKVKHSG